MLGDVWDRVEVIGSETNDGTEPTVVRRIPIRAKVAGALALPLVGLVAAAAIGVSATTSVGRRAWRARPPGGVSVGRPRRAHRRPAGRAQPGAAADARPPGRAAARGRRHRRRPRAHRAASTALHHSISGQQRPAARGLRHRPRVARRPRPACGHRSTRPRPPPARATARRRTTCSPRTPSMVATLFASHDRFSLVVVDPEIRQGDDLVHYGSHATDAVAQLVERLVYIGSGPGGVDQPLEAAEIAELRRDVDRNNNGGAGPGNGDYAAAAEDAGRQPAGRRACPTSRRQVVAEGGEVDPRARAGHDARSGPTAATRRSATTSSSVLDARAAELRRRGRRPPPALPRRRRWRSSSPPWSSRGWSAGRSPGRCATSACKARAMATYRLPAAVQDILDAPPGRGPRRPRGPSRIRVRARDEVADVARPFNDVQESAHRPGRRAGRPAPQRRRVVRQPRPPQPEPAQPPARRRRRARARRARRRSASRSSTGSTTWPPASAATPSRSWCCRRGHARRHAGSRPSTCPTSCGPPSARSRTTSGCSCAPSTRRWSWAARLVRPRPPAGRARSRTACATRRPASWSRSPGVGTVRRLHDHDRRPRPGHDARRDRAGQPAAGRRRVVHGHARPVPGPLRDRGAGRPPRHQGAACRARWSSASPPWSSCRRRSSPSSPARR